MLPPIVLVDARGNAWFAWDPTPWANDLPEDGPWEHPSLGEPDPPAWVDRI